MLQFTAAENPDGTAVVWKDWSAGEYMNVAYQPAMMLLCRPAVRSGWCEDIVLSLSCNPNNQRDSRMAGYLTQYDECGLGTHVRVVELGNQWFR